MAFSPKARLPYPKGQLEEDILLETTMPKSGYDGGRFWYKAALQRNVYTLKSPYQSVGRQDGAGGGLSFLKPTQEGAYTKELLCPRADFPSGGPANSRPGEREPGKSTSRRMVLDRTANRLGRF